jgi:hypothetical protein
MRNKVKFISQDPSQYSKKYFLTYYGAESKFYPEVFDYELTPELLDQYWPTFFEAYLVYLKNHDYELQYIIQDAFDTTDREILRDYLLVKLENVPIEKLDYDETVKEILHIEKLLNRRKKIIHFKKKIDGQK